MISAPNRIYIIKKIQHLIVFARSVSDEAIQRLQNKCLPWIASPPPEARNDDFGKYVRCLT